MLVKLLELYYGIIYELCNFFFLVVTFSNTIQPTPSFSEFCSVRVENVCLNRIIFSNIIRDTVQATNDRVQFIIEIHVINTCRIRRKKMIIENFEGIFSIGRSIFTLFYHRNYSVSFSHDKYSNPEEISYELPA